MCLLPGKVELLKYELQVNLDFKATFWENHPQTCLGVVMHLARRMKQELSMSDFKD
jgi:hypothetical protein